MTHASPDERLAHRIVARELGWQPQMVRRFTAGLDFFVFDVSAGTSNVVVRIGRPRQSEVLRRGAALARQLRALGVALPELISLGTEDGFPFAIQSRLPGMDLGNIMNQLDAASLAGIARAVADAQSATARLGDGARFGYAASAKAAPHASWADVVAAHIERSALRIAASGFFPAEVVSRTEALFARHEAVLRHIPATPFLHDTTTKNVIVTPSGAFSGIVDVDELCFGDPRYAPALTLVAMLVHGGPVHYVDTWMDHAGLPRDDLFRFYVTVFLLDFMSEHGTAFNGNEAPSREEDRMRLLTLFARAQDA